MAVMDLVPTYEDLIWCFEAKPVYRYTDDRVDGRSRRPTAGGRPSRS